MSVRLGRILGIPLTMHISWLVMLGLLVYSISSGYFRLYHPAIGAAARWLLAMVTSLLFFAGLIGHELSHCYAARKAGIRISEINLFIFGGVAKLLSEPSKPRDELEIALAGPAFSIALAGGFAGLAHLTTPDSPTFAVFTYLALANLFVAGFNLLPAFPMDGGRILRAVLWHITRDLKKATQRAANISQMISWTIMGLGFIIVLVSGNMSGLWLILVGWFVNTAAQNAYRNLVAREALQGLGAMDMLSQESALIDPNLSIRELVHKYFSKSGRHAYGISAQDGMRIVTLRDVYAVPRREWDRISIWDAARPFSEDMLLEAAEDAWEALERFEHVCDVCPLIVVDRGRILGIIDRSDVSRLIRRTLETAA